MQLDTRNATLQDLLDLLRTQQDVKLDAVVPAQAIRSVDGILAIEGVTPTVPDTVEAALAGEEERSVGLFRPTFQAEGDIAEKLGIPVAYLRKLRENRIDLYDANVNGWLHGGGGAGPDDRNLLARLFADPEGGIGVFRALLSDTYGTFDHLDVLMAMLKGINEGGVRAVVKGCDLTETRMVVRVDAPEVTALAPALLRGYRSPYAGQAGPHGAPEGDLPIVSAGFVLGNSETGDGSVWVMPRVVCRICDNGATRPFEAMKVVHRGSKLEEGVIRWSRDTVDRSLDLITAKVRDAVQTFLSEEYLTRVVAEIEGKAGKVLENPAEAVKVLGNQLKFTQAQQDAILADFIAGGTPTAGGYMNAVTSVAQRVDAETAWEMENVALVALEAAAAL